MTSAFSSALSRLGSYLPISGFWYFVHISGWPENINDPISKFVSPSTKDEVTLEWSKSPTITIFNPSTDFLWSIIVFISKRAWVGWDIDPSPALTKTILGRKSASSLIMDSGCLKTQRSTPIRFKASIVSKIVSPFWTDELSTSKSITEHPKLLAAIAKDDFVLVLGSQKTFATILSGNKFSFLKLPSSSIKLSANLIRSRISFFDKSLIDKRLLAIY